MAVSEIWVKCLMETFQYSCRAIVLGHASSASLKRKVVPTNSWAKKSLSSCDGEGWYAAKDFKEVVVG